MATTQNANINFLKESYINSLSLNDKKLLFDNGIQDVPVGNNINEEEYMKRASASFQIEINMLEHFLDKDFKNIYVKQDETWISLFNEIMKNYSYNKISNQKENSFGTALLPFLEWSKKKIKKELKSLVNLNIIKSEKEILDKYTLDLLSDIGGVLTKSLVLEINIARVLGKLEGNSSEDRFNFYIENFVKDKNELLKFYREYIVITKIITLRTKLLTNFFIELLKNFKKDYSELKAIFFNGQNFKLRNIVMGAGDKHNGGKSVAKFTFNNGIILMYKPKSLEVSKQFYSLLGWFNNRNEKFNFYRYKIVSKDNYGWEEFIQHEDCKELDDVKEFYYSYGALIAIIYILEGRDFHYENIIAHNKYPVLIDTETLFHGTLTLTNSNNIYRKVQNEYSSSVLGTGLLPVYLYRSEDNKGLDISGISGDRQKLPFEHSKLVNINSDEIHFEKYNGYLQEKENQPKLNGHKVNLKDYIFDIKEGYSDAMQIIQNHKKIFISEGGFIDNFKNAKVRIVVRGTQNYARLISTLYHPDYTRNHIYKDKILLSLWKYPTKNINIIKSEYDDIIIGDIPFFTNKLGTTDLIDSRGNTLSNALEQDTLTKVKENIKKLNLHKINEQKNIMLSSFVNITDYNPKNKLILNEKIKSFEKPDSYLTEAIAIGEKICNLAVSDNSFAVWLGLSLNNSMKWEHTALPVDHYEGISGILYFLIHLEKVSPSNKLRQIIQKGINSIQDIIEKNTSDDIVLSSYYGQTSCLQSLLIGRDYVSDCVRIDKTINTLLNRALKNEEYINSDFISGKSGLLNTLLNESINLSQFKDSYFKVLNKLATDVVKGTSSFDDFDFSFSHGISGISLSLIRVGKFLNNNVYTNLGYQMKRKIDQKFLSLSEHDYKNIKWCNGLTGLGTYYLEESTISLNSDSLKYSSEIKEAILEADEFNDYSICHGALGVVDFLLNFQKKYYDPRVDQKIKTILGNIIEKYKRGDFISGTASGIESYGLFLGLSGVGYQLLRYDNDFPSILI